MGRTDLFREGARLPEELSRLLFLEPVISGRRVLEVGARSDAVARFLIELGATRVVCAHEDKELVEALRAENDLERVDFRVVRPGVLPGDDGAFDLVIDFSLAAALAAGQTFRLTDIARLLSEDGFAVTALRAEQARGLDAILGGAVDQGPVGSARSAAGIGTGPLGYRGLVEALKLQFDVVQVYFQSLLLGYLFGSFDAEPSGDGVSPNTALMGDRAEPAGHYLFSFGNAVPVIEDVALVQVPFGELLGQVALSERPPAEGQPAEQPPAEQPPAAQHPAPQQAQAATSQEEEEAERAALRARAQAQEQALLEIAGRMERLREDVGQLVESVEARTHERDELQAFVEGLEAAVAARDATLAAVHDERDRLAAGVAELKSAAHAGQDARLLAEAAAAELANARAERDQLIEHIARVEGELTTWQNRARILEEAHELSVMRIKELEDALLSLDAQRGDVDAEIASTQAALVEERERRLTEREGWLAERELIEAAVATNQAQVLSLERALDETRALLERERMALEEARADAERARAGLAQESAVAAGIASDFDEVTRVVAERDRLLAAQAQVVEERSREIEERSRELEERTRELGELRALGERSESELSGRLRQAEQEAAAAAADYVEEIVALRRRHDELEADARRLADGVKTLVREREENRELADANRVRAEEAAARAALLDERLAAAHQALTEANERTTTLQRDSEERDKRLRAAQAALEESHRQLAAARDGLQEIAGQRDTLKQVVASREREISSLKDELGGSSAELQRLREQADVQHKALGDARQRLSSIEVERAQHKRREEELGAKSLQAVAELDEERRAHQQARAHLDEREVQLATLEGTLADLQAQREELAERGDDAAGQVARAEEELRVARLAHDEDRATLERTATRAELLQAMLEEASATLSHQDTQLTVVRVSLEEGRTEYDRKHAEAAMLRAALGEARSLLEVERARGDLFHEELSEAHGALSHERARGDLLKAELEEAQQHILELRRRARGEVEASISREAATGVRADLAREVLAEAQERLSHERARADLLEAQLGEAQVVAANAISYATLLKAELDDARQTFRDRKLEHDAALEAERLRSAAALNDGGAQLERAHIAEAALAHARDELGASGDELALRLKGAGEAIAGLEGELKVVKEQHAEARSEAMLKVGEIERLAATLSSAERERDSLLADLSANQGRAAAESQRRIAADEELTKLRVAHNQALAELQRMKTDLEAGKRAPEVEAELSSLKQRVEALEKDNAQQEAEIADKLQRIKQMNERIEQLTDRLGRVETYRS